MELQRVGVTERKLKQFNESGIDSVETLLRYMPCKYYDFTKPVEYLSQNMIGEEIAFIGRVDRIDKMGAGKHILRCVVTKGIDKLSVFWFHQEYMEPYLNAMRNTPVIVCGKLAFSDVYHSYSISAPIIFSNEIEANKRLVPIYKKIKGMSDDYLKNTLEKALALYHPNDYVTPDMLARFRICGMDNLFWMAHHPDDASDVNASKRRMIFDDMFFFASKLLNEESEASKSPFIIEKTEQMERAMQSLPYTLTDDQMAAVKNMREIAMSGNRINNLLQGDVGCGKTIVAFLIMTLFAENGYQSALMAPTQVLAAQHYSDLQVYLANTPYACIYLHSGMRAKEKREAYAKIASGEAQFIVGTHSLLSESVQYNKLALVVTDEEHKFGVLQRDTLVKKAEEGVHSITMSATPIPRSLAEVLYGEKKHINTIEQMPSGRKEIETMLEQTEEDSLNFIWEQVKQGRQAYVVCPMIQESENERFVDVKSVDDVFVSVSAFFEPKGVTVARLTGKDKTEQMQQVLQDFADNKIQVLVATTVIEVGVNVPNASVMMIESAERFGLAQLHQMRGRVGRGAYQSYCILSSDKTDNERLGVMCRTNNGFKIAEADLQFRGTGDLIGVKQSGDNRYIQLILAYPKFYNKVKEEVRHLVQEQKILHQISS